MLDSTNNQQKNNTETQKENIEIVDEYNRPSGIIKNREDILKNGDWHRITAVYIIHPQNGILCHQRAETVDYYANKWQPYVGGHVKHNETPLENAIREVAEEIGLKIYPYEFKVGPIRKDEVFKEWIHTFIYKFYGRIEELRFIDKEIVQTTFLPYERVMNSMKNRPERWASRLSSMELMARYLR